MQNIIWSTGHALFNREIISGKNVHVFDKNGNAYLDMESGTWSTVIGHCHPIVQEVISLQSAQLLHTGFNYYNPLIENVSEIILKLNEMPGGKCVFLCSGSEAIEYGVRLIKAIKPHSKLFTFTDTYCGAYGSAAAKEEKDWILFDRQNCSCIKAGHECDGNCKEFRDISFENTAAFVFEPGSSSGLVKFPSKELIRKIEQQIRNYDGFLLINEVTTGIGRTGKWFGYQHYNISPDIVAIGKGIGNGYPVSVTAINKKTALLLEKTDFLYAQSHQNDALGAAVAEAVITHIQKDKLIEKSLFLAKYLMDALKTLASKYPIIREIRGRGLMIAIEFEKMTEEVHFELYKKGIFCAKRRGHEVIRIDPALTVSKNELSFFIATLNSILQSISDKKT